MIKKKTHYYAVVAIIVLAAVAVSGTCITGFCSATPLDGSGNGGGQQSPKAELAQCLTQNGVKMYGAYWCGHCANQKALFGNAFEYVDYVECTDEQATCQAAGITGYPTWIINGQKYPGEQSLERLAELSGCTYP